MVKMAKKKEEQKEKEPQTVKQKFHTFFQEKIPLEKLKEKRIIEIIGYIILAGCIYYWIHFFFIVSEYEALLYTTYFTLLLISMTCIYKFESTFLNTITSLTAYGFLNISIGFISTTVDFLSLIVGPILHGAICVFQIFIIFHHKIPISKKYILWGILFYSVFTVSYDDINRWNYITGLAPIISPSFTQVYSFYTLLLSAVGIYFYKKKYGILITD